jgi:hypothetical protein
VRSSAVRRLVGEPPPVTAESPYFVPILDEPLAIAAPLDAPPLDAADAAPVAPPPHEPAIAAAPALLAPSIEQFRRAGLAASAHAVREALSNFERAHGHPYTVRPLVRRTAGAIGLASVPVGDRHVSLHAIPSTAPHHRVRLSISARGDVIADVICGIGSVVRLAGALVSAFQAMTGTPYVAPPIDLARRAALFGDSPSAEDDSRPRLARHRADEPARAPGTPRGKVAP